MRQFVNSRRTEQGANIARHVTSFYAESLVYFYYTVTVSIFIGFLRNIYSPWPVRERTMPTERPPLVNEVSDNFCG
jgi:hypothetical protein